MASISRSYRPQTFADVTGQQGVKETLRLEVASGKLGHAYLFGGPRGVGKTTTARIFAKALNCEDPHEGEPCNACAACLDFAAGRMIDVIEMDAASNTGVENVREAIIEHVRFAPIRKFKVYILDEAHMLSNSSWNALLKTVEEPPPYAKFIFITTELHRVPATILSRCQRFDFKRIPDADLAERIRTIAKQEGVSLDGTVVSSITAKADGCLRDGETLLGQLLSLGETKITADVASLVLPLSRLPIAADVLRVWSKRALGDGLAVIAALEDDGVPLGPVFDDLVQAIRLLLLAHDSKPWRERLKAGDEGQRAVSELVGLYPPAELADMALLLMERRRDAKQGADQRFCLELAAGAVCLSLLPHSAGAAPQPPAKPPMPVAATVPPKVETKPEPKKPEVVASQPVAAEVPVTPPAATEEASTEGAVTFAQFRMHWPSIQRVVGEESASLAFVLKVCKPINLVGKVLTLQFQYPFHKDKVLADTKNRRTLEAAIKQVLGASLQLEGQIGGPEGDETNAAPRDAVGSILQVFGGVLEEGVA